MDAVANDQTTKQWENCPSHLCQQQLTLQLNKQKKPSEEKQTKKKELAWAALQEGASRFSTKSKSTHYAE